MRNCGSGRTHTRQDRNGAAVGGDEWSKFHKGFRHALIGIMRFDIKEFIGTYGNGLEKKEMRIYLTHNARSTERWKRNIYGCAMKIYQFSSHLRLILFSGSSKGLPQLAILCAEIQHALLPWPVLDAQLLSRACVVQHKMIAQHLLPRRAARHVGDPLGVCEALVHEVDDLLKIERVVRDDVAAMGCWVVQRVSVRLRHFRDVRHPRHDGWGEAGLCAVHQLRQVAVRAVHVGGRGDVLREAAPCVAGVDGHEREVRFLRRHEVPCCAFG